MGSKAYHKAYYEKNKKRECEKQKQRLTERGVGVYGYNDEEDNVIVYVGSGYIWKRNNVHQFKSTSKLLQSLFEQNGVDRYKLVVLEYCEKENKRIIEQKWIDKLNPICNIKKAYKTEEEYRLARNANWMKRWKIKHNK